MPNSCDIRTKDIQLSDSQIKALPNTYVQVLPAPGAGTGIIVHRAVGLFVNQYGLYTGMDVNGALLLTHGAYAGAATVPYFPWDAGLADHQVAHVIEWTPATYFSRNQGPVKDQWDDPAAPVIDAGLLGNAPLNLCYWNGANVAPGVPSLGGGDPRNTLSLRVWYSLVPTVPFGA